MGCHSKEKSRIELNLRGIRVKLAEQLRIAEELVPLSSLQQFYVCHERHAKLTLLYADATVVRNTMTRGTIDAYKKTFVGEALPAIAFKALQCGWSCKRAKAVAEAAKLIVWPLASSDACCVVAYAMLKCNEVFLKQCWFGSKLNDVQRTFPGKYPANDFFTWVMYGSWSCCAHCRCYFFNDAYFRNKVYRNVITSSSPDLLAAYRRQVPSDPVAHEDGQVGVSSRWWFLPGMYQPLTWCGRCGGPQQQQRRQ